MKPNSMFTNFGSNILLQEAGSGSGSGSRKKEHIWHKEWVKSVGTYGEMYGYVECLLCRDPDHWAYVVGDVDENGHGYVDWDGDGYADNGDCECDDCLGNGTDGGPGDPYGSYGSDGGYGDPYGSDGSYGDIYGGDGYEPGEEEERETIRISNFSKPDKVKNGQCELGVFASQLNYSSMSDLWAEIDRVLFIRYPKSSGDSIPPPEGLALGSNYSYMNPAGQQRWILLQEAMTPTGMYDENGTPEVVPGIPEGLLSEVAGLLGVEGESSSYNSDNVQAALDTDRPYYLSIEQQTVDEEGNPVDTDISASHSVAIIGHTRGVITGKIYTYIIWDFVTNSESEISADKM